MALDQIKFRPGTMIKFFSTKSFALGSTGYNVTDGMEVLFDGTTVEFSGNRFTLPGLRGAIKAQWLVLPEEYDAIMESGGVGPVSANVQVRSTSDLGQNPMQPARKGMIATVESDERIVMSRGDRAESVQQARTAQNQARDQARPSGGVARAFGSGKGIDVGGAEFGTPVARTFTTPAKQTPEVTPNSVGQAIMAADKVKVQPGQGMSESEMLSRMSDDDREAYLSEKEARKADVLSRTVGYEREERSTSNLASNNQLGSQVKQASAPRTVGRVSGHKVSTTEGFTTTLATGRGVEIADLSGMDDAPARQDTVSSEGMTFRNTNGPRKAFKPVVSSDSAEASTDADYIVPVRHEEPQSRIDKDGTADTRKLIAKSICKEFPDDYDFSAHWKRRLATIRLNYEGNFEVIRAIFAAESDDFKKLLLEEFPEAFTS